MEEKRTDLLALLLRPELPNVQKELPTAEYRVKRLSEALGTDVVFKLRALPYGKVKSIRDSVAGDPMLDILLAGCVEPDLKAKELKEKYGGATPAETVKAMLLPGEIEDLSRAVERLCGFRRITIDEVKTPDGGRRHRAGAGVLPVPQASLDTGDVLRHGPGRPGPDSGVRPP